MNSSCDKNKPKLMVRGVPTRHLRTFAVQDATGKRKNATPADDKETADAAFCDV